MQLDMLALVSFMVILFLNQLVIVLEKEKLEKRIMLENIDDRIYLEPPDCESNTIFICDYCQGKIYEGDSYYEI